MTLEDLSPEDLKKELSKLSDDELYELFVGNDEMRTWVWEVFGSTFLQRITSDAFDGEFSKEFQLRLGQFFANEFYKNK